jgi:hypothetical protein
MSLINLNPIRVKMACFIESPGLCLVSWYAKKYHVYVCLANTFISFSIFFTYFKKVKFKTFFFFTFYIASIIFYYYSNKKIHYKIIPNFFIFYITSITF